jgi:hypothetical protein
MVMVDGCSQKNFCLDPFLSNWDCGNSQITNARGLATKQGPRPFIGPTAITLIGCMRLLLTANLCSAGPEPMIIAPMFEK